MRFNLFILATIFTLGISIKSTAQNANTESPLTTGSINEQFEYTINKSSRYEDYRVVKGFWLAKLKTNVLDSISKLDTKIEELENVSSTQLRRIDSLNNQLTTTREELNNAITEKNALTFLGIQMQKSAYQNVTFSIIIILIAGVAGAFFMFKKSNLVTAETKEALKELHEEFELHRKRTLEREKTMARNHLNELNKLRNK